MNEHIKVRRQDAQIMRALQDPFTKEEAVPVHICFSAEAESCLFIKLLCGNILFRDSDMDGGSILLLKLPDDVFHQAERQPFLLMVRPDHDPCKLTGVFPDLPKKLNLII